MTDVLTYLPEMLRNIKEFSVVLSAVNGALARAEAAIAEAFDAQFAASAGETGILRLAASLGLEISGSDEDVRFAVRAALLEKRPYTYRNVRAHLAQLVGGNGVELRRVLSADGKSDRVAVRIGLGAKKQFDTVFRFMDSVVPVNMALTVDVLYNQYLLLNQKITYAFLQSYTAERLRSDTELKEAITNEIYK